MDQAVALADEHRAMRAVETWRRRYPGTEWLGLAFSTPYPWRLVLQSYLTENQLTTESSTVDVASADKAADAPWFKMRLNLAMSPERREQAKEALAELVAMRNDLVHHLD